MIGASTKLGANDVETKNILEVVLPYFYLTIAGTEG
jgi:hypothetical protein